MSLSKGSGVWTDALDDALRAAAAQALADGCALLLVLHTWILPDFDWDRGVVEGTTRLVKTLDESPAIVAAFTGHRHINRITAYRDYLVVDTACLIGFPLGYRCVTLSADGFFKTRFHTLNLPDLLRDSYDRSTPEENRVWEGHIPDRDVDILLPRLRALWS